jgi:hypothetical protein
VTYIISEKDAMLLLCFGWSFVVYMTDYCEMIDISKSTFARASIVVVVFCVFLLRLLAKEGGGRGAKSGLARCFVYK